MLKKIQIKPDLPHRMFLFETLLSYHLSGPCSLWLSLLPQVSHRFRELMKLFHTSCDGSSEDEEDATSTSNADQLSDKDLLLSEEEPDD